MGINFELRYEYGELAEEDLGTLWAADLPGIEDRRFPYLRLVNPYGDTVFSQLQVEQAVLEEVERWAAEHPTPRIGVLLAMARRCAKEPGTALWLIGD